MGDTLAEHVAYCLRSRVDLPPADTLSDPLFDADKDRISAAKLDNQQMLHGPTSMPPRMTFAIWKDAPDLADRARRHNPSDHVVIACNISVKSR